VVEVAYPPVEADARQPEGVALLREHDPAVAQERLLGDHEDLRLHRLGAAVLGEVHREPAAVAADPAAEHRLRQPLGEGGDAARAAQELGGQRERGASRRRKPRISCSAMKASVGT
jgi:hypothetical protein